jgi:hypothetical protein
VETPVLVLVDPVTPPGVEGEGSSPQPATRPSESTHRLAAARVKRGDDVNRVMVCPLRASNPVKSIDGRKIPETTAWRRRGPVQ